MGFWEPATPSTEDVFAGLQDLAVVSQGVGGVVMAHVRSMLSIAGLDRSYDAYRGMRREPHPHLHVARVGKAWAVSSEAMLEFCADDRRRSRNRIGGAGAAILEKPGAREDEIVLRPGVGYHWWRGAVGDHQGHT